MKTYIVFHQTNRDESTKDYVEIDALSSSEAEAIALDILPEDQFVISVWERVL